MSGSEQGECLVKVGEDGTDRHVEGGPGEGLGDRLDQLTRDTEVADLEPSVSGDEDIGRLDVCRHTGKEDI